MHTIADKNGKRHIAYRKTQLLSHTKEQLIVRYNVKKSGVPLPAESSEISGQSFY